MRENVDMALSPIYQDQASQRPLFSTSPAFEILIAQTSRRHERERNGDGRQHYQRDRGSSFAVLP